MVIVVVTILINTDYNILSCIILYGKYDDGNNNYTFKLHLFYNNIKINKIKLYNYKKYIILYNSLIIIWCSSSSNAVIFIITIILLLLIKNIKI